MWLKIKPRFKHKKLNRLWWQSDWRFIGVFLVTILLVTTGWPFFPQFYPSQAQVVQLQTQTLAQTPEARLREGRNLYQIGQFSAAVSLWQQAARDYELQGEIRNQALSLNYLSSAYQKLGEWQQAEGAISICVCYKIKENWIKEV